MQLVFHTGAHFTEEERLIKCLLRNKEHLSARGVVVPAPGKYRKLLRHSLEAMSHASPTADAREVLLEVILEKAQAERVLLSNAHLFGAPRAALRRGMLYPHAPERMSHLADVFRTDEVEVFMAIRNPATFLPCCYEQTSHKSMADFLDGADPLQLFWSDTLNQMREAAPEIPITVWCNEDAPLVWSQIIRAMGRLAHGDQIIGGFDLLGEIMSKDGMARFVAYLENKPNMNEMQLRRVMAAFLEKFVIEDAIEEEIDLPGWTAELMDALTEAYDEDLHAIGRIPGVQVITP
jgi:hypothetical protein